jgi:hypothetical protein
MKMKKRKEIGIGIEIGEFGIFAWYDPKRENKKGREIYRNVYED